MVLSKIANCTSEDQYHRLIHDPQTSSEQKPVDMQIDILNEITSNRNETITQRASDIQPSPIIDLTNPNCDSTPLSIRHIPLNSVSEMKKNEGATDTDNDGDLSGILIYSHINSDGANSTTAKRRQREKWRRSAYMIWQKFVDHRSGNTFLKVVKDSGYGKVVKQPMSLDMVKQRIKNGVISTTSEFHRDILLMLANAIMYNDSESEGLLQF